MRISKIMGRISEKYYFLSKNNFSKNPDRQTDRQTDRINCGLSEFQALIDLYKFVFVPLERVLKRAKKGKTNSF